MNREDSGFRPPQQARSRRTLERLEETARKLLVDRSWDELGLAELCREARTSVGAFYARFSDKQALLTHLADTACSEFDALLGWCAGDVESRRLPLMSRARQLVAALHRYVTRHRGVLRAMIDRRMTLPWQSAAAHTALHRILGESAPADRRRVAIAVLLDALAGHVVTRRTADSQPLPDIEAVTQMLAGYLQ